MFLLEVFVECFCWMFSLNVFAFFAECFCWMFLLNVFAFFCWMFLLHVLLHVFAECFLLNGFLVMFVPCKVSIRNQ